MVIGVMGENCSGKSTLAKNIQTTLGGRIVSGKDYLRLAKSEDEAKELFTQELKNAENGESIIYVISEKEQISLLPESPMFNAPEASVVTEPRLALVKDAGTQYAKTGDVDEKLLSEICSPMIPEEQYAKIVNGGV